MGAGRVLALDVGTSGTKAVIVDGQRGVIASCTSAYGLITPRAGWVEQDLSAMLAALATATRELLAALDPGDDRIDGIGVTAQMFNLQALDGEARPVGPMLSWLDQRAADEAAALAAHLAPDRQFEEVGSLITAKDVVPRVHWLRTHAPEDWARARWLVDCKEAVVAWLSGRVVTDPAGASAFRLMDLAAAGWGERLCRLLDVPIDRLAPVAPATGEAGRLRSEAARAMGLPAGLPVFVGSGDVPASQIGSGALGPGDAHMSLGTAVYLGIHLEQLLSDPARRLGVLCHAKPGAWILWLETATGGGALSWIARTLGGGDGTAQWRDHARLDALVEAAEDGVDDLLFAPWLSGERVPLFDDAIRGAFVGLALHHGMGHLVRAVMEGVAYQVRWAYEYGLAYGVEPGVLRAVGGGGLGDAWLRIMADTLARPVEVVASPRDAAALGAAALALVGLGLWPEVGEVRRLVRVARRVDPDPARAARHERGFSRFRALYAALAPLMTASRTGFATGAEAGSATDSRSGT